jgi:hypothetical protein
MPGDTRLRRELPSVRALRVEDSRAAHEEQSAQAYSTVRRALFPSATPQIRVDERSQPGTGEKCGLVHAGTALI